ncbi:MAG TPA: 2-(1,2-epoxy-1,2-dihydrophenyl)acetyl-CoA isomerase PaaG [Devosia sp.]|jgi:2-(1,2-epoxy-1,2-dihydrophenyl)acetyl-CoA isomerase|nr:2-(1,2-epoxy-1,2-dihydrophenyl)acetyl-CoA isomerase PaaG [Devosia sp.]
MASGTVLVSTAGGITRLTLNRPDKLNAFNAVMREELTRALEAAERDESCRVIVLTGAGRAFSAGQDLADGVYVRGGPQPDLGLVIERYIPLIKLLKTLAKPIIASVNGMAAGAGVSVALACDLVYAARSASFMQAFARIGLVPDCGGTWFLPRLVGEARAKGLAMLAEPLMADKAEAWGLIWKAVDDDKLTAEVDGIAARLAQGATYGLGLQKQAFAASSTNTLEGQLNLERDLQRLAGRSPDYAEGVAAFLEKRTPNFTGRKD